MSKIQMKKIVLFMTNMSIQPLWWTHFIEILLILEFELKKFIVGMFSYKAHFRPQISSNDTALLKRTHKGSDIFLWNIGISSNWGLALALVILECHLLVLIDFYSSFLQTFGSNVLPSRIIP